MTIQELIDEFVVYLVGNSSSEANRRTCPRFYGGNEMMSDEEAEIMFWVVIWLGVVFSGTLLVAGYTLPSTELLNLGRLTITAFFMAICINFVSKKGV